MPTPNEVELLIRARNEAGKTLERLGQELDEIVESQKALAASSELAQKSQADLVAQAKQLLAVSDALNKTLGKVDAYKRQQQAVDDLNKRLAEQKANLAAARIEFEKLEKPTRAQVSAFKAFERSVTSTEKSITKSTDNLGRLGTELAELGVSTERLEASERDLATQQARVTAALETTRQAAGRLEAAQRELADVEKQRKAQADDTAATVKRRAAEEEAAIKRRIEAQKRFNDLAGVRLPGGQAARDRLGDAVDTLGKELDRQEEIERSLIRQRETEAEIARRNAEQEASLRRQQAFQQNINRLLNVREADPERSRAREADARAAVAEDAARREARAQELRAAAAQRVLDVNRRADEVEARLQQARERGIASTNRVAAALRNLLGIQERATQTQERRANAENRVQTEIGQTAAAIDRATAAVRRQNAALQNGFELQRTALSLFQRIRGQLLSIAGAYVGVFGALNFVSRSIEDVNTKIGIQNRLLVVSGNDLEAAGRDYQYLREQADRLGTSFPALAAAYSKFAIAAKGANLEASQTNFIFESFAEVSKVFQLSQDETAGVFKALEQVLSKSKVQAEELRGQLGDRLSGAFNVFAESVGISTAELDKLLESGEVSSDFLLAFAKQYRTLVADQLPSATNNLDSSIQRLNTGLFDLRVAFLEGPFRAELEKLIKRTTDFLRSEDGAKFAQALSTAFAFVAKAIILLGENIEIVGTTLAVIFGARTIAFIAQFAAGIGTAVAGVTTLAKALGSTGLVAAVRLAGVALAGLLAGPLGVILAIAATGITIALKVKFDNDAKREAQRQLDEAITGSLATQQKLAEARTRAEIEPALAASREARDALSRDLDEAERKLNAFRGKFGVNAGRDSRTATNLPGRKRKELSQLEDNEADLRARVAELSREIGDAEKRLGTLPAVAQGAADAGFEDQIAALRKRAQDLIAAGGDKDKKGKKERQKSAEAELLETIAAEEKAQADARARFLTAEQQLQKDRLSAEENSLAARLQLIDIEAQERIKGLEEIRKTLLETSQFDEASRVDGLIEQVRVLQSIERQKATEEDTTRRIAENEQKINDLLASREQVIQTNNDLLQAGQISQEQATTNIDAAISTLDPKIRAAIQAARDFLLTLSGPEAEAALASLDAIGARFETQQKKFTEGQILLAQLIESNLGTALDSAFETFQQFVNGAASLGDVFKSIGQAARQFFSQLLIDIGQAIIKAIVLKAILEALGLGGAAGGGGGGGLVEAIIGSIFHKGGVVGQGGEKALFNPAIFRNATRYHDGGIVGLKSDEVPAILQKGETVIPKGGSVGGSGSGQNIQVLNTIDTDSIYQAAATSATFKKTILNIVRAERGSFKQALA